MFPHVEFPLYADPRQSSGESRRYLEPRINAAATGSFSAASMDANGALTFRRNVRGRYVNYHTPCLPLAPPNIRTRYDPVVGVAPSVVSQVSYFQWNYKDVYIPPHLLHQLLTETTALEQENAYDPLLGSTVTCLPLPLHTLLFHASGPLLQTLTCSVVLPSLALRQCEAYQLPGRILEIQATKTQGTVFVGVRTCYHVAFFQGPSEAAVESALELATEEGSEVTTNELMALLAIFQTEHCVASVTISPYIAGEGLVVMETGGVYMWCQGQPLQVLQQPLATPTLSSPAHFWRCCYGSHPRSIVLAEHSGVSLGDFRTRRLDFSSLLTSPSEWVPAGSLISSISPSPHPHHLHITTSLSLLLLDTRQPRWPLLEESHDLGHAPQIIGTTSTQDNHQLVMVCDCVEGESVVFSRTAASNPIHISCAPHIVTNYRELENMWQDKPALLLLGNRLQLPLAGACLFSFKSGLSGGVCGLGGEENERFAAVSMSVLGDLFYQLWSYNETPPTDTPTSCNNDSWLQEAWLQEQELQTAGEERHVTMSPVNFEPTLKYLVTDPLLCPACLITQSIHFPSSPLPTVPSSQPSQTTPPLVRRCGYCRGRLAPLRSRQLETKLVGEGLLEETTATDGITMATPKGVESLRSCCEIREPGGNHDDRVFWEGWREDQEVKMEEQSSPDEATPTPRSHSSAQEKPYTPSSQPKTRRTRMGF